MASLIGIVSKTSKSFFLDNSVSVDNWTFKCFYKWTTSIVIFCSVAATARQFFGSPIACDAGSVRMHLLRTNRRIACPSM